ncbi:transcriptional regulator [Staphylococcus nepalensis]|uniref:helix-turn-helix domain-containing protein n=1 Tax=Staphylococcus nepalensis TaxID=214473 RepID=UPI000D58A925|nr:helix-turn-helix transcriptional regulator [Staphylococcus nepalensis]AWI44121.1 transcriptional regulator [Staphylococcus nepalensis]
MIQSRLSILMAERGLKISDIYEETGISKTTLMAISENTGKGVQFDTVDKLCNFLGVTPCEFFEYSPYLINYKMINSEKNKDALKSFDITIKNQNYEKDFYIDIHVYSGDSYNIPVKTGDFDWYLSVQLKSSDHYTDSEFFDFVDNLSISFRTEFINRLITGVKNQLIGIFSIDAEIETIEREQVSLKKNDYIALKLFENSKFETLKKFYIK